MKRAYFKCIIASIIATVCFLSAAVITVQMLWFDSELHEHAQKFHSGAKHLEAARAYRHETYQSLPSILFLCVLFIAFGILAIRFYNHAKSEFSR